MSLYTTEFQSVSAGDVRVGELRGGSTLPARAEMDVLSSLPGMFTIPADTARLIAGLAVPMDTMRLAA